VFSVAAVDSDSDYDVRLPSQLSLLQPLIILWVQPTVVEKSAIVVAVLYSE